MTERNILIFKPGPIGDFLHSLPVIHSLKSNASHITVVTGRELKDLVEGDPCIDRWSYIPSHIFKGDLGGLFRFIGEVRKMNPHTFVDLKSNMKSFIIRGLSGAEVKVRYRKQRVTREGERRLHAIENLFHTIRPILNRGGIDDIRVYLREEDLRYADNYIRATFPTRDDGSQGRKLVALNPNVSIPDSSRHWPPEYFAELGDRAYRELSAEVILIGGPEDRGYCEALARIMQTSPHITAGKLTLGQTGGLLSRCKVLVTGDTGPMHLAAAVGTKVIALFGSMDARRAGPYGEGHVVIKKDLWCAPCEEKICPLGTTQCMKDISVGEVFEEARKILVS